MIFAIVSKIYRSYIHTEERALNNPFNPSPARLSVVYVGRPVKESSINERKGIVLTFL